MKGILVVRAEGAPVGLQVADVEHVLDLGDVHPAPSRLPAVRGVTAVGSRLLPLVHLRALLGQGVPPQGLGRTGVIVRCGGARVVLEVDDAEAVLPETPKPVPEGWRIAWASAVLEGERVIPVVDVEVLAERLSSVVQSEAR